MYQHLTAAQMQQVLSRTSEHSFAFNIERFNTAQRFPVATESSLHGMFDRNKVPQSAAERMGIFCSELDAVCRLSTEIGWKLRIIDHYETPDEVKLGVGYQGFEPLLFGILERARESLKDRFGAHGYERPWTRVLEFNRLCSNDLEAARKDAMVDLASYLAATMVACRSEAMRYGFPMENVLEAYLGSTQENINTASAIKTTLFGLQPEPQSFFDPAALDGVSLFDNKFHK